MFYGMSPSRKNDCSRFSCSVMVCTCACETLTSSWRRNLFIFFSWPFSLYIIIHQPVISRHSPFRKSLSLNLNIFPFSCFSVQNHIQSTLCLADVDMLTVLRATGEMFCGLLLTLHCVIKLQ